VDGRPEKDSGRALVEPEQALATGAGSIFGFLIARAFNDAAIMAPLFIAASFLYGLSVTVAVLIARTRETREELMDDEMIAKFSGPLLVFASSVLFLTAVQHLAKFHSAEHGGGAGPLVFWLGQIGAGTLAPVAILLMRPIRRRGLMLVSIPFLVGGRRQSSIGGQAWPLAIFPGCEVSSAFFAGQIARRGPTVREASLGASDVALAMLLIALARLPTPFLPSGRAQDAATRTRPT